MAGFAILLGAFLMAAAPAKQLEFENPALDSRHLRNCDNGDCTIDSGIVDAETRSKQERRSKNDAVRHPGQRLMSVKVGGGFSDPTEDGGGGMGDPSQMKLQQLNATGGRADQGKMPDTMKDRGVGDGNGRKLSTNNGGGFSDPVEDDGGMGDPTQGLGGIHDPSGKSQAVQHPQKPEARPNQTPQGQRMSLNVGGGFADPVGDDGGMGNPTDGLGGELDPTAKHMARGGTGFVVPEVNMVRGERHRASMKVGGGFADPVDCDAGLGDPTGFKRNNPTTGPGGGLMGNMGGRAFFRNTFRNVRLR